MLQFEPLDAHSLVRTTAGAVCDVVHTAMRVGRGAKVWTGDGAMAICHKITKASRLQNRGREIDAPVSISELRGQRSQRQEFWPSIRTRVSYRVEEVPCTPMAIRLSYCDRSK